MDKKQAINLSEYAKKRMGDEPLVCVGVAADEKNENNELYVFFNADVPIEETMDMFIAACRNNDALLTIVIDAVMNLIGQDYIKENEFMTLLEEVKRRYAEDDEDTYSGPMKLNISKGAES